MDTWQKHDTSFVSSGINEPCDKPSNVLSVRKPFTGSSKLLNVLIFTFMASISLSVMFLMVTLATGVSIMSFVSQEIQ